MQSFVIFWRSSWVNWASGDGAETGSVVHYLMRPEVSASLDPETASAGASSSGSPGSTKPVGGGSTRTRTWRNLDWWLNAYFGRAGWPVGLWAFRIVNVEPSNKTTSSTIWLGECSAWKGLCDSDEELSFKAERRWIETHLKNRTGWRAEVEMENWFIR